jgi:mono/diheme cytochrome c family protein
VQRAADLVRRSIVARAVAAAAIALAACDPDGRSVSTDGAGPKATTNATVATSEPATSPPLPDGGALVEKLQCNRCHGETGTVDATDDKHCFRCHERIQAGTFQASRELLAEWRPRVAPLRHAVSLGGVGTIVRASWVEDYLVRPFDVRPHLRAEMPRLVIARAEAKAIAEFLAARNAAARSARAAIPAGDPEKGRALFEPKGCAGCHAFTGARTKAPVEPGAGDGPDRTLAPDLRYARDRLERGAVADWILDPASVKRGAAMPKQQLTPEEARDLAAFVLDAPLDAPSERASFARLPPLERPVGYDEVAERVLHKMCWHCHAQPDFARGDGGPGNTGGFGFSPRKLDLSTYEAISSGYLDDRGERVSVFSPGPTGDAVLVGALVARHSEARGELGPLRGMPLGLPPLSAEDIQLVESWTLQGHPR